MKIKCLDGKELDTEKMADVPAMHMEAISKCREILKEAGVDYILFSIDSVGGGGGSVKISDDAKKKLTLIKHADDQLRAMFQNCVRIVMWDDKKYDFPENLMTQILKNIEKKDEKNP